VKNNHFNNQYTKRLLQRLVETTPRNKKESTESSSKLFSELSKNSKEIMISFIQEEIDNEDKTKNQNE